MSVFDSPLSSLGEPLPGQLALYRTGANRYPYFISGDLTSKKALVFFPGLTSGIGMTPYLARLTESLKEVGWKLVQPHWSSAYMGFGVNNLDKDAQEMEDLVKQLEATGTTHVVFMGNSTGCQNTAKYLSTRSHPIVVGGIMQAPVSDREFWSNDTSPEAKALREFVPIAEKQVKEGNGDEIVPREVWTGFGGRITYSRMYSLIGVGGDDDYFSSDLPVDQDENGPHAHPLSTSFGKFSAPTLALWSENDEFAWKGAPPVQERLDLWTRTVPKDKPIRCFVVPGADHEVHQEEAQKIVMREVVSFIQQVTQ